MTESPTLKRAAELFGVLAAAGGILTACRPPQQAASPESGPVLAVTNSKLDDGSLESIVELTNGLYLALDRGEITIYFQTDSAISCSFDPQSKKLKKTVLETPDFPGEPGQWVADYNADGVPDHRRIKGQEGGQIFYDGKWVPSQPGGGSNALITIDGKSVAVFFDGKRWTPVSPSP